MINTRDTNVLATLTDLELEVLTLLVQGNDNNQIAVKMGICVDTVKNHMRGILKKLGVSNRTQAAIKAFIAGLMDE